MEPLADQFYEEAGSLFVEAYDAFYGAPGPRIAGDVAFYERVARETGGPVLELACGTGRIAVIAADSQGIVNHRNPRGAEVAAAHGGSGHGRHGGQAYSQLEIFPAEVEKCFVFFYGPADIGAVLVLVESRAGDPRSVVEEVIRIQIPVAEVLV